MVSDLEQANLAATSSIATISEEMAKIEFGSQEKIQNLEEKIAKEKSEFEGKLALSQEEINSKAQEIAYLSGQKAQLDI